jgi:rhodanese-related sulfurtransferase
LLGAHWLNQMPTEVDRGQVKRLLESGAQLVEVLPADEYEEDHIPGAMSLPLRRLEAEALSRLDRNRPVIVYCWDMA